MTIVDACLFAGEREMLQLRMLALAPFVDHFIVVACTVTHQGEPADIAYISGMFHEAVSLVRSPVPAQLTWVTPSLTLEKRGRLYERAPEERGPAGSMWFQHIERQHRDGVAGKVREWATRDPHAVVMVSDVDEIPSPEMVAQFKYWGTGPEHRNVKLVMEQRFHSTALDLLHPQQPWLGTCVSLLEACEPQKHRDLRGTIGGIAPKVVAISRGGWHFSWFGNDRERARKLETFSHAELTGQFDPVAARETFRHSNGEPLRKLNLAETWTLDWPLPLLDGSMPLPEYWLTEDTWRPAS